MLKRSRNIFSLFILTVYSAVGLAMFAPQTAFAAPCPGGNILTLKPWYSGLEMTSNCSPKSPVGEAAQKKFVWTIALNIVEDILQITGYIAVGFVIYGGFLFMTSGGSPERAAAGRKTITNALIGVVIALSAVLLVNLVARNALGIA